ncbi:MAG TPA: hypothetical protein VGH28_31685 [Polyangiaceae bacterium]|jgi:hypothetical protein
MRALVAFAAVLVACSNDAPPNLGDYEGGPVIDDDAFRPPVIEDAGSDAGTREALDFEGVCTPGEMPVWHFFDFQTHTPGASSLSFSASTADTESALDSAALAPLATVNGADITTWTGVDVDPALEKVGTPSRLFLRITIDAKPDPEAGAPALVHYRQQYDCVVGQ